MAPASKKTTGGSSSCCFTSSDSASIHRDSTASSVVAVSAAPASDGAVVSANAVQDWTISSTDLRDDQRAKKMAMSSLISESSTTLSTKGIPIMLRAQSSHPLDPLSAAEISVAVATVRAAGATPELRDSMRFVEVVLLEPDKHVVALADAYFFPPFQPSLLPRTKGGPVIPSKLPARRARLVVYNKKSNETSTWIVELSEVHAATRGGHHRGKVISSQVVPDVQPPMDAVEYAECEAVVKDFPPFREAMKKRGIEDMDIVMVDAWCVGYHSDADAPSRRLAKPLIFCRTESDCPMENGYARPVEGIHVVVDMQNMVVIEFEDRKLVPLPPADPLRNYTPGESRGGVDRSDVKPLQIIQPEGPSFRVNGYFVEWQKWNFRIGFTPREGLIIYSVAYVDGSRGRRPVAHRLSFVEMVVPYGDPNDPHYRKNAFDAGEDGLGKNAHSLKKGCDCLGYIKYFDAHFTNFTGGVETLENCVCLHEEDHGILWKHQDWRTGLAEVRRSRRLTVSFVCTVANYEYGFFWHFYQDGKIEAEVKLTGILSLGALQPGEFRKYGTMIAPGLYAPVHQHFFVARMDMAVDCKPGETNNQVVEVDVKVEEPGENNVHNNAFYAEERLLKSESEAMRDCNPLAARHWIVRNTRTVNRTGHFTGYKLVPGSNCLPLAGPEAKFLRRAAFLKHNLWVTSYARDEMYPGGEFPNQNPRAGEGLATWVKKNRSLEETNIVLWYVFGITHVPRLEDWPVMPVERIGFMLMPHGFFNCSPAVDVPPNASDLDTKEPDVKDAVELLPEEELEASTQRNSDSHVDRRARKIARFKRQRAAESKLLEIKERKERRGRSSRAAALSTPVEAGEEDVLDDDGEEEREAWFTTISLAICKALDLLEMLKKEEEMLSAMKEKQEKEGDTQFFRDLLDDRTRRAETWHRDASVRAQYTKPAPPITCATFAQDVLEGRAKVSQAHEHKHQPMIFGPQSVISGSFSSERERMTAQVFQPGFRMPTMSIEEAGLTEMEIMNNWQEMNTKLMEEANSSWYKDNKITGPRKDDEDEDEDDEAAQDKARAFDDWKDDNPRGAGNKKLTPCG